MYLSLPTSSKVNEIMTEVKKPRYHAMLFHWLMETKISLNSLLKTETIGEIGLLLFGGDRRDVKVSSDLYFVCIKKLTLAVMDLQ